MKICLPIPFSATFSQRRVMCLSLSLRHVDLLHNINIPDKTSATGSAEQRCLLAANSLGYINRQIVALSPSGTRSPTTQNECQLGLQRLILFEFPQYAVP